ncbi:MAG: XrtA/PEP-CTERM system histidine kinase PrsK [Marinobacter sp.]|uniref:XrtA/PEP-CTERM system histidine kinase PrsK n=1 Tax=unclassified Marinobacter TaxID=83889 RepID=UPI00273AB45E|nr:XrtA/PEP-CTERM system histidine kinase PrsK [Marinobacter sp. MDS2]MDP4546385.1 PEP-CTERM system histidine kinase PrsK [Marinobacter sp. MDS2]
MFSDLSVISYGASAIVFAVLSTLVATRYLRRELDRALFLSAFVTTLWASALVSQSLWGEPGFFIRYLLELLRDTAWLLLLFALLRDSFRQAKFTGQLRKTLGIATTVLIVTLLSLGTLEFAFDADLVSGKTKLIGQLALSLLGLSLIEQIWRNSPTLGRSSVKYLCIGTATIFAYDFIMYADALLFGQVAESFWDARGFINAALVPLFAVNIINSRKQPVDFQLSRAAVFHAGALIMGGGYLLLLAIGGYYVRSLGGEWGDALQVLFITIALAFLVTLVMSRRIRARIMVFISQNFFDYKYDYREEWLRMTKELANLSDEPPLPERAIRILADLVESNAGVIWLKSDQNNYELKSSVNVATPKHTTIDGDSDLVNLFKTKEWIIDLAEYRADPLAYDLIELPEPITKVPDAWLIVPLYLGNELYGIAMIGRPYAKVVLNWENFDLIKVVARQTCNLLAQADAQNRLSRAMQFEAVSKASAFMVHDLKTLIAQLSLLVKNAPKHRANPAFIDDMISTTDHAVRKMSNLVDHVRKPAMPNNAARSKINLTELVRTLAEDNSQRLPAPQLIGDPPAIYICAEPEQLKSVLGHLIRNAQDATPPDGEITLNLKTAKGSVVLFIQDTGTGMTSEFIRSQLFKPFESTKGLTGMGIGAYQAREYVLELGGNIDVTSEPGVGSCFSVRIPMTRAVIEKPVNPDALPKLETWAPHKSVN